MRKAQLLILPAALLLAACQPQAPEDEVAATPSPAPAPESPAAGMEATDTTPPGEVHNMVSTTASATLAPTEGNEVAGRLEFAIVDGGYKAFASDTVGPAPLDLAVTAILAKDQPVDEPATQA